MRRFWIMLLAVAVALVIALPAGAGKPDCSTYPDGHPLACDDDPPEPPAANPCPDPIELSGSRVLFECDWAPTNDGATDGIVTVTMNPGGEVSHLVVMVRDSSPGDLCELSWEGKTTDEQWFVGPLDVSPLVLTFALDDERDDSYWFYDWNADDGVETHGEHWCEPYDPVVGQRTDLNGDPLHLAVSMRAKKGTVVEIALVPSQEVQNP